MSTVLPILYSFVRCPYAIRARLALHAAQITYELREVDLKNKPASLLQISPKGTVPVLLLNENQVIEQSREIMLWALQYNDPMRLLNLQKQQWTDCNELIDRNDGEFKRALDRYKYPHRYTSELINDWKGEAEKFILILEKRLNENSYLFGNSLCFADLAVIPFIRQFAKVERNWLASSQYQKVFNWLTEIENSTLFKSVMQKNKAWKEGDKPIIIMN